MRKYIIFGATNDYWRASFKDISNVDNATYIAGVLPKSSSIVRKIQTAHCCTAFAANKNLPFKSLWYKKYYPQKYHSGEEYIFVFFYNWRPIFQNGYIDYLRKKYPGCKCVLLLFDINLAKTLNIPQEKERFDHIMVFERNFAKANDIEYYPLVYSDYRHEIDPKEKDIDLLFVGWAKGRYKFLKGIYDHLTSSGVNCQFYLTKLDEDVPPESGIHTAKWVPYEQYTALLKRAKCLLDIVPKDTDCNTLRVNEALSYKCKILTNNVKIVSEEFYDPKSIATYTNPEDIAPSFLLEAYTDPDYNGYIEKMTPRALVDHLDKVLF